MLISCIFGWLYLPPVWFAALMLVPLLADGLLQALTRYESGNIRRLVTGTLFGVGIMSLFLKSAAVAFEFGVQIGQQLVP